MPQGSVKAMGLTDVLFNWQAVLIILFAILIGYFWWTSTWKQSMAKTGSRFLLWCVPTGLYVVMLWILYWLMHPLRMLPEIYPK
jgi:glucan phosphoethanolaminetransferase (alkaline phosphatase superfamily)